jgi:hypothetical protein
MDIGAIFFFVGGGEGVNGAKCELVKKSMHNSQSLRNEIFMLGD